MRSLRRLAAAYGVVASYRGVDGLSRARPEALASVLRSLGAPLERIEDADDALRTRLDELGRRLVPLAVPVFDEGASAIPLTHYREESGRVRVRVELEDGTRSEEDTDLESFPIAAVRDRLVRRALPVPSLPHGYHRLEVSLGDRHSKSMILRAPTLAYRGPEPERSRRWGLFSPLYALRTRASLGIGDFSDLGRFSDLVASFRGSFAATLPFLAAVPNEASPYSPLSRKFWNEIFVDPRLAPEWRDVGSEEEVSRLEALNEERRIDYASVHTAKRKLLEAMSRTALLARPRALEDFLRERPDTAAYARFRAAAEERGAPWPSWSEPPPARDLGDSRFLYHVYAQALAEEQIGSMASASEGKGVRLYLDMPLGVHPHGFDTWSNPSLFANDAEVGAPPDAVFPDGQSWGFPPILPDASRAEGHRYVRECLSHVMRHAGLLRIDHVMGLHRQFWIPAGFEKKDGVYVRYPAFESYAVHNLESHRHRSELVGENLGIVPQSVNRALDRHRWRGIYVLQFRLTGNAEAPHDPVPRNAIASFNTHDTPTYAGFRKAKDLDERVESGLLDRERARELARLRAAAVAALDSRVGLDVPEVSQRSYRLWLEILLGSEADLVVVNVEDLWLEEQPQNVPGRLERPNWRSMLSCDITSLPPEIIEALASIVRPA